MSEKEKYQIIPFTPKAVMQSQENEPWDIDFESMKPRFAIADNNGKILDDAQGYGYKSSQKAYSALNWKYLGGMSKSSQRKDEFSKWKKSNPIHEEIVNKFYEFMEINFKEIAKGEVTEKDIWNELFKKYSVEIPEFVKREALKNDTNL